MFLHIYQKRFCNIYRNCYIFLPNVMRKSLLMFNDTVSLIFNRISVFYFGFFFSLVSVVILKINSLVYPLSTLKNVTISHMLLIHIANYRCIISWRPVTHKPQ